MPLGAEFLTVPVENAHQRKQQGEGIRTGTHEKNAQAGRAQITDDTLSESSEQMVRPWSNSSQWACVDRLADTLNTALMMLKTTAPTSPAMNTMMIGGMMAVATWMR